MLNRVTRIIIALVIALTATGVLTPPATVSASYSYYFVPSSAYLQTDEKGTLHTYGFSGPPYPARVDWVNPSGNTVSYCPVGSCGVSYTQQISDNGLLVWRDFYFYINGQNRVPGTYTAIVYQYDGYGLYTEQFRASFTISGDITHPNPRRCYVNAAAVGANNGNTWVDAYTDLQSALGSSTCTEAWVQAGVYKPTTGTSRTATFRLKNGVSLYGGFFGNETALDQRDPAANVTILSGDVDNNDSQTPIITDIATVTGNKLNSYHVVTGVSGSTIDGFTITAGYAMCPKSCSTCGYSCPTTDTLAYMIGGGMFNRLGSPAVNNVKFIGNFAGNGGGLGNYSQSSPRVSNVTFQSNFGYYGGGMMNRDNCSPIITNTTFVNNIAQDLNAAAVGSAGGDGGGMSSWYNSNPVLTNVTFHANRTDLGYGAGMENYQSSPVLTNVTFSGNSAGFNGGGMYNGSSSNPTIYNSIFWNNTASSGAQIANSSSTPSVNYSVVQDGYPGGSNIVTTDPLLGGFGSYGGFTNTFSLLIGSSAIDTGSDAACPPADQRGMARPQPAEGHCDIGAFEYGDTTPPTVLTFTAPANVGSFTIPITAFTAEDDQAITGYLITPSSSKPLPAAEGWSATAPVSYTVAADGTYTLYPWAKDAAGNVSAVYGSPAEVVVVLYVPSTNADLSSMVLSTGALTPVFTPGTTDYTHAVGFAVNALTVTPTLADVKAAVTVNGAPVASGAASGPISLSYGNNAITVVVTAEDGFTTKTYTVNVTRNIPLYLPFNTR